MTWGLERYQALRDAVPMTREEIEKMEKARRKQAQDAKRSRMRRSVA